MNGLRFDERFSDALKAELVSRVEQSVQSKKRRRVLLWGAGAITGAVALAGVGAAAAGILVLPGGEKVTPVGSAFEGTYTGKATLDLGAAPQGTTAVRLQLTCLTPGSFTYPDGVSTSCTSADLGGALADSIYSLAYTPGMERVTIATEPETRWKITATYVNEETIPWARNTKGETYGVISKQGEPDLIAVVATSGLSGYVYKQDLHAAEGNLEGMKFSSPQEAMAWVDSHRGKPVPVYDKEGKTIVGEFKSGH